MGSVSIPLEEVVNILLGNETTHQPWRTIIIETRLPKVIAALLCGAALPVSGLKMQTLFRNPLAGPYIMGISSGAGLGVAIFIMGLSILGFSIHHIPLLVNYGVILFAMAGSLGILLILLLAIRRIRDVMTVLILGVMIGSIITALIGVIQFYSYSENLKYFVLWTMGDLSSVNFSELQLLAPVAIMGIIASFLISKSLNLYLLGEAYAQSLGVNIKRTRILVIVISAILAGGVTAYCGPIGFIGIVVPHMARLISGSADHRVLIPLSVLLGMCILLLANIIAQLPGSDKVLPINSITALIGIPFIIWILLRNKSISNTL